MDRAGPSIELDKRGKKLLTLFCHMKRVNPIIAVREPMEKNTLTPTFH